MCLRAVGNVCCLREGSRQDGSPAHWSQCVGNWFSDGERKQVLGKYWMHTTDLHVIGEGTSSVCRSGTIMGTAQQVAIKVYKPQAGNFEVQLQKFRRQISVLQLLQEPFQEPADASYWCEDLERTVPSRIFMQLIDYSKDAQGNPGPDPKDGQMYVVTELASYSLKDYIKLRRENKKHFSRETLRTLTRAIMLVMAGLHAKGLVHLDLKPENLMIFGGVLKLIDVDGCVRVGSRIQISDSSLSFSPCYCAPEWAAFVIEDSDSPTITASPGLDVWSTGITICELVTLSPVLKNTYASFMRHGRSHQQAAFLFMEWLSSIPKAPLPSTVLKSGYDDLLDLLGGWLLVPVKEERQTLASCLSHDFVRGATVTKAKTGPLTMAGDDQMEPTVEEFPATAPRLGRKRLEDHSSKVVLKTTLWKLNEGGNLKDPTHYLRRDMWIAANGSLCYFSLKEDKRLVLLDGQIFSTSTLATCPQAARQPAFVLRTTPEHEQHDQAPDEHIFACDSEEDYTKWVRAYESLKMEMMRTVRLGPEMAKELKHFRLSVNNRRKKVGVASKEHTPAFKASLWKCKANGDPKLEGHWFEREMWLSENGCLVYYSKLEERELVYYTDTDLIGCRAEALPEAESSRPWAFQVLLSSAGGLEFAPGFFAAESEEMRERWLEQINGLAAARKSTWT